MTNHVLPLLLALSVAACASAPAEKEFTEAMAEEHKNDAPVPGAAGDLGDASRPEVETMQGEVIYGKIGDRELRGVLSKPKNASRDTPAIIVVHEWWGLNDNVKTMADRLAKQGYVTLAVDMYDGKVAESPSAARAHMEAVFADKDAAAENIRQAHAYLAGRGATKFGSIGWCFGGGWSLQSAILMGDSMHASVIYYGHLETDADAIGKVKAPLLGLFGAEDGGIPVDGVRAFQKTAEAAGVTMDLQIYDGAGHGFANPSGKNYQESAARDAWGRTLAFFDAHLR